MAVESIFQQEFRILGGDFNNAGKTSTRIKEILKKIGMDSTIIRRVAIASYEAEMNVVVFARRGLLKFSVTPKRIVILVEDEGQGIENIDLAMQEGYSTAPIDIQEMGFGAGMGLPNIKNNTDKFEISSTVGKGTRLKFAIDT
ncbi:MAG: anti-sigma regulatory factor [Candidatus Cloacimonetes bacterium]|nr:anti-sigma regulatory factor [Candidatus Cloacimonadota bacterium]